jgi:two-component system NtrC family response regulator
MNAHVIDILREFNRVRASSPARAIGLLIDAARRLVPRAGSAGCVMLERAAEPRERRGDAKLFQKPERIAQLAEEAVTEAAPFMIITQSSSARALQIIDGLNVSSLAWVPLSGHLPAGPQETSPVVPIPIAALIVETDRSAPPLQKQELQDIALLAELAGEVLFAGQDAHPTFDGRLPPQVFRRMLEHWIALARIRGMPLSLALLAVEGLERVNARLGFEAGDQALEGAVLTLLSRLPQNAVPAHHGGAVMAVLLLRQGPDEAMRSLASIIDVSREPHFRAADVTLHATGAVAALSMLPESRQTAQDLISAAEAALHRARTTQTNAVMWTEEIAFDDASHPFSDLTELDGAGYQRLLAVWRLLDAMSRSAGLNEIVSETLRALMRPFRAERTSLWRPSDDGWTALTTIRRQGLAEVAPSDRDRELVLRIHDEADVASSTTDRGTHALAIACREGPRTTAVLCLASDDGTLSVASHDVAFLRALTQQIGRALKDVAALEESRRQRQRAEQRLQKQSIELRRLLRTRTGLLGTHEEIRRAMATIERAARSTVPVLLTGETGTGKGAAARLIHQLSHRRGPWVVVDCGAIPGQLLESELFGYEKGAFTGAEVRKIGRFEEAHQGTIFLDEIGELPLELQPKLLRVLQESMVRRVGGTSDVEIDFRLIAATNRDLKSMVARGQFREDLYFRVGVVEISIPPLRERGEDVLLLSLYFLREYCAEVGRDLMTISSEGQDALLAHNWPGNVRELQNRLRRAVVMATANEITPVDLELSPTREMRKPTPPRNDRHDPLPRVETPAPTLPRLVAPSVPQPSVTMPSSQPTPAAGVPLPSVSGLNLEETLADWFWHVWLPVGEPAPQEALEAFLLRAALQHTNGSRRTAAELLGMHVDTLTAHLQKLSDPALSRSLRAHPVAQALTSEVARACLEPSKSNLMDRVVAVILRELLVYCRGNKSEMARLMGCGRRTLLNQLARHQIVLPVKKGQTEGEADER